MRHIFKISRKNLDRFAVFVYLNPKTIKFRLSRKLVTNPFYHLISIWKPLRKSWSNRFTNNKLYFTKSLFPMFKENFRDIPQIACLVVSVLNNRPQILFPGFGNRKCIHHCRITNSQPQSSQRNINDVFYGYRIEFCQKICQSRNLLINSTFTRKISNTTQLAENL